MYIFTDIYWLYSVLESSSEFSFQLLAPPFLRWFGARSRSFSPLTSEGGACWGQWSRSFSPLTSEGGACWGQWAPYFYPNFIKHSSNGDLMVFNGVSWWFNGVFIKRIWFVKRKKNISGHHFRIFKNSKHD